MYYNITYRNCFVKSLFNTWIAGRCVNISEEQWVKKCWFSQTTFTYKKRARNNLLSQRVAWDNWNFFLKTQQYKTAEMGTNDTKMGWNCQGDGDSTAVQSCMKPTATRLSPRCMNNTFLKYRLGTNTPHPTLRRPHLCGNVDCTYCAVNMVLKLILFYWFRNKTTASTDPAASLHLWKGKGLTYKI